MVNMFILDSIKASVLCCLALLCLLCGFIFLNKRSLKKRHNWTMEILFCYWLCSNFILALLYCKDFEIQISYVGKYYSLRFMSIKNQIIYF